MKLNLKVWMFVLLEFKILNFSINGLKLAKIVQFESFCLDDKFSSH